LKPSYGRVSRHGLIAYASSLDTPGVLARSVWDAAAVLDAIAGPDGRDSTCAVEEVGRPVEGWAAAVSSGDQAKAGVLLKGLRVGVPREFRVMEMEPAIVAAWAEGIKMLQEAGAEVVEVRGGV
jgi:aspartyl-tRNA(Asn)/glutamyl-tRNA(Gln) amidotransferase subunit A